MQRISLVRLPGSTASSGASGAMPRRARNASPPVMRVGALDRRMADEDRVQPIFLEERRLERQQRQHQIEIIRHRAGAIGAAGPHLRGDVVDRGDARRDAL